MAKSINEKCFECAHQKAYKGQERTPKGFLMKIHPECYKVHRCSRLRAHYRDLDHQRERQRNNHRYLKFKGDRAYCAKGKLLGQSKDGSIALIVVLRGVTSGACKNCGDFMGDEE